MRAIHCIYTWKIKIVNNSIEILNVFFCPYLKEIKYAKMTKIERPLITEHSFTVELCFSLQPAKYLYTQEVYLDRFMLYLISKKGYACKRAWEIQHYTDTHKLIIYTTLHRYTQINNIHNITQIYTN